MPILVIPERKRLLRSTHALVHFCVAHPHHYRAIFFAPGVRQGKSVFEQMSRFGAPLFGSLTPCLWTV